MGKGAFHRRIGKVWMRTWGFEGLIIGGKLMGRRNLMNWWLSMRSRSEINAFGVITKMTTLAQH